MSATDPSPADPLRPPVEPDPSTARVPTALRWLLAGVVASIVLLLGLPILMLVDQAELVATIERETAGTLSEESMGRVVVFVMIYAIGLHLLCAILLVWLTSKVLRGRQWARIALTVYLVAATAGSLYSASIGGTYLAVVIPTDLLHVLMVVLLWAPPSVRRFFAARRAVGRASV